METHLIITPENLKPTFKDWKIEGVLNPAAIRMLNKDILLIARVAEKPKDRKKGNPHCPAVTSKKEFIESADSLHKKFIVAKNGETVYFKNSACKLPTISHFRQVVLDKTGFKIKKIENIPLIMGSPLNSDYGVEDPRIVKIGKNYLMTYVTVSSLNGISSALAVSKNLKRWKRKGIIFQEQNKDVVLFPEKIKNKYVALNRPETSFFSRPSIWLSYSEELIYWGREKKLMQTRRGAWDNVRIGAGAPPIKTKHGWLMIYHGVEKKERSFSYNAGAALLDLKNPSKLLARSPPKKPLFRPAKSYEKDGFTKKVVFPTGIIESLNKKYVLIYSGGADRVISVRKMEIDKIIKSMEFYS